MNDTEPDGAVLRTVWSIYSIIDLLGAALCIVTVLSAVKNPARISSDTLTAGLCGVYAGMAIVCGTVKIASAINGAVTGCSIEAFALVAGMGAHFQIVSLIGMRTVALVVFERKRISNIHISVVMSAMCAFSILGTSVFNNSSAPVPVGYGTYCFYDSDSKILLWLASLLVLSVAVLCVSHLWVMLHAWRVRNAVHMIRVAGANGQHSLPTHESMSISIVARRLLAFVMLLVLGWGILMSLPLLAYKSIAIPPYVMAAFGCATSIYNILVPILYGLFSPYQRRTLALVFKCGLCKRGPGGCIWQVSRSSPVLAANTVIDTPSIRTVLPSPRFSSERSPKQ